MIPLVQHALHGLHALLSQADVCQREDALLFVQKSQHGPFPVKGRDDRDADVHIATGDAHANAAILRQALFGDVQPGHDLDA
jgi:hypothetical protein